MSIYVDANDGVYSFPLTLMVLRNKLVERVYANISCIVNSTIRSRYCLYTRCLVSFLIAINFDFLEALKHSYLHL